MKKILILSFLIPSLLFAQAPVLFFSDIDHGHRSGNNDVSMGQTAGVNGDFVTIWGKNLGNTQSNSTVTINGSAAAKIYYWGPADSTNFAADLFTSHGMQAIIFQIASAANTGSGTISVTVSGLQSNTLPFTVMTGGKTYFISKADGSNNYNGLYPTHTGGNNGPWRDHAILTASGKFNPGDVVYIRSGIYDTLNRPDWNALIVTYAGDSGTADLPKAVVAYPKEIPLMCHDTLTQTRGFELSDQTSNWTIAKLLWKSGESVIDVANAKNIRIIGNGIYNTPSYYDPLGMSAITNLSVFGNHVHNCGQAGNKLSHLVYYEGYGAGKNVNIAWNYLHDEYGGSGIHIYGHTTNDLLSELTIHDNLIYNIPFDGINVGGNDAAANPNWIKDALVYNNVVYHTSYTTYGPWYSGIRIDNGGCSAKVFNNTVNDCNYSISLLTADSAIVYNNIFGSAPTAHLNYTMTGYLSIQNNIYTNDQPKPLQDPTSVASPIASLQFANYAAGDFHLLTGSNAIDAGTNSVSTYVLYDAAGTKRPQGAGFDIGAYEFLAPTGINELFTKNQTRIIYTPNEWILEPDITNGEIEKVELYDVRGKKLSDRRENGQTLIHVKSGDLPKGIYIVRLILTGESNIAITEKVLRF